MWLSSDLVTKKKKKNFRKFLFRCIGWFSLNYESSSQVLQNGEGKKVSKGSAKYVYVYKWDMSWRNYCVSSLVTKNVKVGQKWPIFFKWGAFWNLILKNTFFRKKLSKLHQKDAILHVTCTFSLKQGVTRRSSESIWLPLGNGKIDFRPIDDPILLHV